MKKNHEAETTGNLILGLLIGGVALVILQIMMDKLKVTPQVNLPVLLIAGILISGITGVFIGKWWKMRKSIKAAEDFLSYRIIREGLQNGSWSMLMQVADDAHQAGQSLRNFNVEGLRAIGEDTEGMTDSQIQDLQQTCMENLTKTKLRKDGKFSDLYDLLAKISDDFLDGRPLVTQKKDINECRHEDQVEEKTG